MRVAMVAQWLRAAAGDPDRRPPCATPACIGIVQVGWVLRLFLPEQAGLWAFYPLAALEIARARLRRAGRDGAGTPWHPGHISERYGLFGLIVLGECIATVTIAHPQCEHGARLLGRAGGRDRRVRPAGLFHLVVVLREPRRGRVADVAPGRSSGATATTSSSRPWPRWAPGSSWRRRAPPARVVDLRRPGGIGRGGAGGGVHRRDRCPAGPLGLTVARPGHSGGRRVRGRPGARWTGPRAGNRAVDVPHGCRSPCS